MGLIRRRPFQYGIILVCVIVILGLFIWRTYPSVPKPSALKVVPLEIADFPQGWHLTSTESDNDWHANFVYQYHYESVQPYLSSSLNFVRYDDFSSAKQAYTDYRSRVFWFPSHRSNADWMLPLDITIHTKIADQSEIACIWQPLERGEVEICTLWAQYNKCLIKFSTQIGDQLMSQSDFENLITIIDRKMEHSEICLSA